VTSSRGYGNRCCCCCSPTNAASAVNRP